MPVAPPRTPTAAEISRAFSEGCDSRLAGRSLISNPYLSCRHHIRLWEAWKSGWDDANENWPRRLPPVRVWVGE